MKNVPLNQLLAIPVNLFLIVLLYFSAIDFTLAKGSFEAEEIANDRGLQAKTVKVSTKFSSTFLRVELSEKTEREVRCLALNIYFEARGESELGQRAVGHVVMNRVAHPAYPSSVCAVVRQGGEKKRHRCQFSWWCDGRSDRPKNPAAWNQALRVARQIYAGNLQDITDGALWYHATYVTPYWSKILLKGDKIGQHIFYLEHKKIDQTL